MSNRIDQNLVLDGGSYSAFAAVGRGRVQWVIDPQDPALVPPVSAALSAGAVRAEVISGFGAPVNGVTLLTSPATSGLYLRQDATDAGPTVTLLYGTANGGVTWRVASFA